MTRNRYILFIILLISAALRLWSLGSGDTLSDEVLYSFRAIGMLDFDEAAEQTTPLEWFDPFIPSWTKFSFHDHPPLVFAVQYVFIRILGETPFAFRLPSALLGLASIYLLYLIGTRLYGSNTGLIAAALLGITVSHIAISRLGLQESYVIFFMLLVMFFFLKAEKQKKYYISVGIVLGFALLTKYTTGILIPIFLSYIILFRREDVRSKFLWIGALCTVLIFSPVLIYNIKLYQAVGHFDFQLSYIAGQNPEVWSRQPGKEEFPTFISRVSAFLPNAIKFNSWMFLLAFATSIIAFLISLAKKIPPNLPFLKGGVSPFEKWGLRGILESNNAFLLLSLFWVILLIIVIIGPSSRFLAMLTPFMALAIVAMSQYVIPAKAGIQNTQNYCRIAVALFSIFFLFEASYSINSQIIPYPKGPELWAWSSVRYENYNWGYGELDKFMRDKTDGRMPALAFEPKYHFIGEIHKKVLAKAERAGKKPLPALFVYDKNINSIAQLWTLDRLQIYHAWPVITANTYEEFLKEKGADYFLRAGFQEIYYIFPTKNVPWKKPPYITDIGTKLEQELTDSGIEPYTTLENKRSEPVFHIYRKELTL